MGFGSFMNALIFARTAGSTPGGVSRGGWGDTVIFVLVENLSGRERGAG
jgi:hypothetical protein